MKKNEKKLVYLPSNTEKEQMKMTKKDIDALSDKEIVDGLKVSLVFPEVSNNTVEIEQEIKDMLMIELQAKIRNRSVEL